MEGLNVAANVTQGNKFDAEFICRTTIILSISAITIVGHAIHIRVISHASSFDMGSATKLIYRALSVADILTCTGLLSGIIMDIVDKATGHRSEIVCKLTGLLMTCAPGTSTIFILLLNIDRFIYITRPLLYHSIVTTRKTALGVGIAIPYVSVSVAVFALAHDRKLSVIRQHESISVCKVAFSEPSFLPYTLTLFSFNMWLVAVILIIIYCRIIAISRQHLARIKAHRQLVARTNSKSVRNALGKNGVVRTAGPNHDWSFTRSFQQNIRSLSTPLLITGCYLMSWIPFSVVETYIAATGLTDLLRGYLYITVATAAALNSGANLLVYFLSRRDLRQTAKRVLCRREN